MTLVNERAAVWTFGLAAVAGLCSSVQAAPPTPAPLCGGQAGLPGWFAPGIYSGTLGQQRVTLQLKVPGTDDDAVGAYFYASRQIDLALRGSHRGSALVLAEEVWAGPEKGLQTTGCLTLNHAAGQHLTGEWKSLQGKNLQGRRLAVSLAPLKVKALPLKLLNTPGLRQLRAEQPLTFLKLNTAWARVTGGATMGAVREPLTGIVYPRVAGAPAALSGALQDRQLLAAAAALDCKAQIGDSPSDQGDGFTLDAAVTRLTPRLVSLHESANYYCGGAHPDNFDTGLILDRQSGQMVKFAALWPGLNAQKQFERYTTKYPKAQGADCLDAVKTGAPNAADGPAFTGWLTPSGLTLVPTFLPHVVAACAEAVTLTYTELRRLADPHGPYFADLDLR
ncbi:hypothetical protein GCM10022631_29030 [Deinococcus rubellus]|uniref:DUF3298 domain-containing protein n=1 Tax=Deinococcus rubellus TaxID=1889240 RepID=A0ABY5YJJ2_9DEIO|nr:hypothetical protein [Deinococcus rubellus]UWX65280.1 hypothetical protein N0D28_06395 [Deinococcus rubellus]